MANAAFMKTLEVFDHQFFFQFVNFVYLPLISNYIEIINKQSV